MFFNKNVLIQFVVVILFLQSGLLREAFTDADNFGIQFPMDLDVRMKAVMLGACFLIVSLMYIISQIII